MDKKKVLADHKQIGKKYIPPMAQLGFSEILWTDKLVPELLWLGLLNDAHGLQAGADLAISLAKAATKTWKNGHKKLFASTSSFSALDDGQRTLIAADLKSSDKLNPIRSAIKPLAALYPKCPLGFLFDDVPEFGEGTHIMDSFKASLDRMFYRWEKPATMAQANAVYIAFVTDILKVRKGLSLANFLAIEKFPDTEESKRVASGVRCAVSMFFSPPHYDDSSSWPAYFWDRGFKIEPCILENLS